MASFSYGQLAEKAEKEGGFTAVPPNEYDVEIGSAEFKRASTGSPMDKLELIIANGPEKGRKVFTNVVMKPDNPNSVAMFFVNMRNLGLGSDWFASVSADDEEGLHALICQALVGRTARVQVKKAPDYNGRPSYDVAILTPKEGANASAPAVGAAPSTSSSAPPDLPPGL